MTTFQKISVLIYSLATIALAIIIMRMPELGYSLIVILISLILLVSGIKELYDFFTLTRFMVGGKRALYKGVFLLDIGLFTGTLYDLPRGYILMYLALIHGFAGLVEILRVNETRKYGATTWKFKFAHGLFDIFLAIACIAFSSMHNTVVLIYCFGLIYSALGNIVNVFRKNTFIYIQ